MLFFFPDPAPPPRPPLPSDGDYVPPSRPPPPALDTTDDESEDLFQTTPTASQGPIMVSIAVPTRGKKCPVWAGREYNTVFLVYFLPFVFDSYKIVLQNLTSLVLLTLGKWSIFLVKVEAKVLVLTSLFSMTTTLFFPEISIYF